MATRILPLINPHKAKLLFSMIFTDICLSSSLLPTDYTCFIYKKNKDDNIHK